MTDKVKGTPLMRQYREIKGKYSDSLVLFRMGDFYETFFEDAKITAKVLGIVLTKRSNGAAGEVPLAGFPYHSIDNYLHKLVNAGYRVAICEQVEDPKLAKGIVKREVIEVVTPGTLTSDHALSEKTNQYLGSLIFHQSEVGYSIIDQSTGELFLGECALEDLRENLRKFAPREIILSDKIVYSTTDWYRELKPFITSLEDWLFDYNQGYESLTSHFKTHSLKGFGCEEMKLGISAAGAIFYHIQNNLNGSLNHVSSLKPVHLDGVMGLDGFTIRNLEIFRSLATQGTHGTLLDILDETVTAGGGRLLKYWLFHPLLDINKLMDRQNIVEAFYNHNNTLSALRDELKQAADIQRILGKINRLKANPRDVVSLGLTLAKIPVIQKLLAGEAAFHLLTGQFIDSTKIVEKILNTLNDEPPLSINKGDVIKPGIHAELDEYRELARGGKDWISRLQSSERERTGITKLKIGFNRVFGYYIEITKAQGDKVPDDYIRKQTLVNSERYVTPDLKEYEQKILSAEESIEQIENEIFQNICREILLDVGGLQVNAQLLNQLDILSTFAEIALRNKYIRPELVEESVLEIEKGRHPVVEKLVPATDRFIPNDLFMDCRTNQIHLITGPNMAGKSTYLRQIGLLVLMAQIGSYIPAEKAKIGIVDKLFTRVGASDNLAGGESTFLVEMNEAANILNNATKNSLVLLDEIGRGTATFDGLSLAWAITEYLHNHHEVAARTLFATHYHELTDLEETLNRLENHHVAVKEFEDKIVFMRKIVPGTSDRSYGIHVAQMAGLPDSVIRRATDILNHHLNEGQEKKGTLIPVESSNQMSLFKTDEQTEKLKKSIAELDINQLTPLKALQALDELKKEYNL